MSLFHIRLSSLRKKHQAQIKEEEKRDKERKRKSRKTSKKVSEEKSKKIGRNFKSKKK